MKRLVIVLPTFNERDNLEDFVREVLGQEKYISGYEIVILIADDMRSNDGTEDVAKKLIKQNKNIHLIKAEPGLGVGLIKGHQYSLEHLKPDIMAQIDADGQVEVDVLSKLVKTIEEGYDLAIGSRFVKGGENKLPFSRKIFSLGASFVYRLFVGPFNIREVSNSARAFTPELFKKINLDRLPWKEKTFIVQPAFLNEAILAGAKYKEIPLVFKDRAVGYSKMKVVNYTYDVFSYSLDALLHRIGIDFPLFKYSRRAKTLIKFATVGVLGTLTDFAVYNLLINLFNMMPATSKGFSTEVAIINNFFLNNLWTFRNRKTKTNNWQKFLVFNLVSLGGLAIGVLIVKFLHTIYGDGSVNYLGIEIPFYNVYFFAAIPPVMVWNFTINHFVTWKNKID